MPRTYISLPERQMMMLDRMAEFWGVSRSEAMRRILDEFFSWEGGGKDAGTKSSG